MAGKSPITVDEGQRQGLLALSHSRDRGEADRARAILLTLSGWTSGQIAEAFGVREDTVRVWRSAFMTGGIEALKKSVAPGRSRQGQPPSKPSARWPVPRRFCRGPWPIARTGRCRVWPMRSTDARAYASPPRGCPWCCAKGGFPLAASAPHAEGAAGS